ncbi:MAG TPA: HDOD domain-containing protein, partial [Methylophilus sp.]
MAKTIGRFEVTRSLGKSAQGEVYLATDTRLGRQVAIKTLVEGASAMQALLQEARIVSTLQHKNIVTLFDAGENEGTPYLVYAYAEGQTLAQMLREVTVLPAAQAVQIICSVLEGVSYAHQHQVLHLDLKPANIMIADNGQPLIMDFGIAASVNTSTVVPSALEASFIAPEVRDGQPATVQADLYALGRMLQVLVTGELAAKQKVEIEESLQIILRKATDAHLEHRYANADAMQAALLDYLKPVATHQATDAHSTMDFLLRRMRSKSDFPALSTTISEINKVVDDDTANVNLLVKSILQDFALTNKLLKLVNTVTYGQFGGQINTISKAVVILGFETVRNAAMTLILLDFLQNKAQAAQLKDDVLTSFFAGIVAAQFASEHHVRDAEEAMICSMFRNLGKILASFYFFEESQQIARMVEQAITEDAAATQVLGVTYNELGIGIAKSWNFPLRLIRGMRKLSGDKIAKQHNEIDNLAVTVNLAHELCAIASYGDIADKSKSLTALAKRYEHALTISEQQLRNAMESGLTELAARARIIGLNLSGSALLSRVHVWVGDQAKATTDSSVPEALVGVTQLGAQLG